MQQKTIGWLNGIMGVLIFSGSLPATRVAVQQIDPIFLTVSRATIAGTLALAILLVLKQKLPTRSDMQSLLIIAIGVVIGFPLLTALALQHVTAAHSVVFIGLLPLSTAIFGTLRGGERPKLTFWFFSALGSATVVGFAFTQGLNTAPIADAFMLGAIILAGLGYAEGAKLSRRLGGWQVISWALVLALPVMATLAIALQPPTFANIEAPAWIGLGYASIFSMFIGFVFWNRGLAIGGTASIGQLQLLQPFFSFALAAVLLQEQVTGTMLIITLGTLLCVVGAQRFANFNVRKTQAGPQT